MASSPRLRLLGEFRLELGTKHVDLSGNAQRLLAFIGLRGQVCRTVLAGTLWPDVTEGRARGSLRTTLWKLPRAEPPLIGCCGDVLRVTPALRVDVHALTRTALGVVQGNDPEPHALPSLRLLTVEDLLPGWDEDWVLLEREHLRQLRLHALDELAEALIRQGRPALAIEAAWASVRAEPLRESAHRAVVSAHLAEGNVSEAVRHYEAFCRLLEEELGVAPSPLFARMLPERAGAGGRKAASCTRASATTGSPSTTRWKDASTSCTWT
ncbi:MULTISPECIES: BTAD domain-containing putative transcriptional regulator [Streptomyces]|uniref:AfsR/SARP family transcriptional regulator n=1 Tax=Streptomyces TaxID=1883 RepID=UPI000AE2FEBB|nr:MULTISPECIES: BTAD domain-containing putative transcriptional regulator [Streptomyces]MDI5906680.1 BTAD domain-containing putative transcriptional regulator [Streptomyces sp. 12257]